MGLDLSDRHTLGARRGSRRGGRAAACLALLLAVPAALTAQPFWPWSIFAGHCTLCASNGRLEIPHSPALNPASAITIEAWVSVNLPSANQDCRSIVGKDYTTAYWVGYCGLGPIATLRAYIRGIASQKNGGVIPNGKLIHIAVTSDGATRNHYIDGELVASFTESGPPTASTAPLDIGGDASWQYSPNGLVNEVRLWSVARSQARQPRSRAFHEPYAVLPAVELAVEPLAFGGEEMVRRAKLGLRRGTVLH